MFYFTDFYGKKILKSSLLEDYNCFFTTRDFILSQASLTELEETAKNNRKFLMDKLKNNEIVNANQVHGCNIELTQDGKTFYDNTDAIISNKKNSIIMMNFADCTPIILYSPKDKTGAVIHAGWRGTALKIARKTVQKMKEKLNINPENIIALIGPSIGKCCFETDEDVFKQLIEDKTNKALYNEKNKKYYIDLKLLNYNQLVNEGVKNVDICSYCTFCMSDIFFSYRKEKNKAARHSAIVQIK